MRKLRATWHVANREIRGPMAFLHNLGAPDSVSRFGSGGFPAQQCMVTVPLTDVPLRGPIPLSGVWNLDQRSIWSTGWGDNSAAQQPQSGVACRLSWSPAVFWRNLLWGCVPLLGSRLICRGVGVDSRDLIGRQPISLRVPLVVLPGSLSCLELPPDPRGSLQLSPARGDRSRSPWEGSSHGLVKGHTPGIKREAGLDTFPAPPPNHCFLAVLGVVGHGGLQLLGGCRLGLLSATQGGQDN